MPKIELKFIQKELEAGKVRPVYFIHGPERMKAREILRRIEKTVLGAASKSEFNYEKINGGECSFDALFDSFQSFSMMGGVKLIVVHEAEEIKNLEQVIELFEMIEKNSEKAFEPKTIEAYADAGFSSVMVLVSKGFDARRKWAKAVQADAAVMTCEEVSEDDREPWIDYLAKRRSLTITASEKLLLRSLDPWSLDIIDQELFKIDLAQNDAALREEVILSGVDIRARDEFIDALFCKDQKRYLKWANRFGESRDVQLPIVGLIAWNIRHLKVALLEQETRSRSAGGAKYNPYLAKNLDRWKKHWNLRSVQHLEESLFDIDFALKNINPKPSGSELWANLSVRMK